MFRSFKVLIVFAILHSGMAGAQNLDEQIDSALALLKSGRPQEASQSLQWFLGSSTVNAVPPATQARAYTYLAMSEWMLYRRPTAEAAIASALSVEGTSFLTFGADWAQQNSTVMDSVASRLLGRAENLYQDADYDASVRLLAQLIVIQRVLPTDTAAEIHKYLAFNLVAQRQMDLARREFGAAIRLNPRIEVGEESAISPKIRRAFFSVQDNSLTKTFRSSRRRTVLRSVVAPGWGQIHRGSRRRGFLYAGLQASLLAGSMLGARSFYKARNAYETFGPDEALYLYAQTNSVQTVQAEVASRFGRYQSAGRRANILVALFAGAWAVNIVDAVVLVWRRDRVANAEGQGGTHFDGKLAWNPDVRLLQVQYGVNW